MKQPKKANFIVFQKKWNKKLRINVKKLLKDAINGISSDPTDGATFFYSGNKGPSWAKGLSPCKIIGGHKFFKGIAPYN